MAVYGYLSDRANREGQCWPAVPTIAREIKLSEATVRRAIKDLRKAGLIETEQRYRTKGGTSHGDRRRGSPHFREYIAEKYIVHGIV